MQRGYQGCQGWPPWRAIGQERARQSGRGGHEGGQEHQNEVLVVRHWLRWGEELKGLYSRGVQSRATEALCVGGWWVAREPFEGRSLAAFEAGDNTAPFVARRARYKQAASDLPTAHTSTRRAKLALVAEVK